MIHLIYTYSEGKPPRDGSGIKKTVRVYKIKQGTPVLLVEHTDTFADKSQLVIEGLEKVRKVHRLPSALFTKNQFGGWRPLWELREKGVANINEVS